MAFSVFNEQHQTYRAVCPLYDWRGRGEVEAGLAAGAVSPDAQFHPRDGLTIND